MKIFLTALTVFIFEVIIAMLIGEHFSNNAKNFHGWAILLSLVGMAVGLIMAAWGVTL
jgi:hypothetical protein